DSGGLGGRAGYYEDYGNGAGGVGGYALDEYASGSEPDDEWDPSAKGRRAPKSGRGRKQTSSRAKPACGSDSDRSEGEERDSRRGHKKKHKVTAAAAAKAPRAAPEPAAPGQFRSGAYTDDEERMFNEGLELFGRSWSEISGHVGTRDAKSIRSHAQKCFIKLFRDGVALPAKVRESGEGYTLSGRPLDPNSAAARPYLQHVMELDPPAPKAPKAPKAAGAAPVPLKEAGAATLANGGTDASDATAPINRDANASDAIAPINGDASSATTPINRDAEASSATTPINGNASDAIAPIGGNAKASDPAAPSDGGAEANNDATTLVNGGADASESPVRTEYAMSRPQRSHARPTALRYDDPHQMVRCTAFQGQPLSGAPGSQPFRLVVHSNAQLQMDFHAHLMLSEVIGLLGGQWDAANRVLTVARAFPCAALEGEDAHTNVEMDPDSQLHARDQIAGAGLRVVGWYHSHPTFRPDPSIIDIDNQTAYQALFRDSDSSEEPFVGAIVGPYDPELPGPVSAFNWFYVGRSVVDRGLPKRLVVEPKPDCMLPADEQATLLHLLDTACCHQHCAALEEAWRPSSTELRSLKMAVSLACRMPWLAASGAESESAAKQASAADLLPGQRAVQDPLLAALGSRFSAGVFRPGPDGKLADAHALERVYAAYLVQWAAPSTS
ncbi:hypothetical protein GGF42_008136, partial [Coemansia sp. RSA 2424]